MQATQNVEAAMKTYVVHSRETGEYLLYNPC